MLRLIMMGTGAFAVPTFRRLLGLAVIARRCSSRVRRACCTAKSRPTSIRCASWPRAPACRSLSPTTSTPRRLGPSWPGTARSVGRLRLRPDSQARDDRHGPAGRNQSAWLAVAEISRRRAGAVGDLSRRDRIGRQRFSAHRRRRCRSAVGGERVPIGSDETAIALESRLSEIGATLVVDTVDALAAGTAKPLLQDAQQASRAPRLKKSRWPGRLVPTGGGHL